MGSKDGGKLREKLREKYYRSRVYVRITSRDCVKVHQEKSGGAREEGARGREGGKGSEGRGRERGSGGRRG